MSKESSMKWISVKKLYNYEVISEQNQNLKNMEMVFGGGGGGFLFFSTKTPRVSNSTNIHFPSD